jgi:hypothetical protein
MRLERFSVFAMIFALSLSSCSSTPVGTEGKENEKGQASSETEVLEAAAPTKSDPVVKRGMGVAQVRTEKKSEANRKPAHHRWENYRWARTKSPSTLQIANCLNDKEWDKHFKKATKDWNKPKAFGAKSTPLLNRPVKCPAKNECLETSGMTTVCNGEYGENGWLGLATIYIMGDYIVQGAAQMNDTYFKMSRYNNPNEKRHVMCQEVAHTFGLGHQSVDGSSQNSCMDYFPNIDENAKSTLSTRPNEHDFEELHTIYAELDGFTTLAEPTRPSKKRPKKLKDPKNPKAWGKLKSQSPDGRGSIYENNDIAGATVITHVYWAEEAAEHCPTCDHRDHDHDHHH